MFESISSADEAAVARADALLDLLTAHATELATVARTSVDWPAARRVALLARLDRLDGGLADARARILVAEKHAETSLRPGDRDFEAARSRMTRAGLGEVRREVRQAEAIVALDRVATAVREGAMPIGHLDALARVSGAASPAAASTLASPEVQRGLVELAQRQSAREFGASVARLVAEADPAAQDRTAAAQHAARFLALSHQREGTFVKGRLDRLAGEVLAVALASVGHAPDADRDKQQADADALVALAERALSGMAGVRARRSSADGALLADPEQDVADSRVSGVANRPTVSLLVPAETFAELREHARRAEHLRACAGAETPAPRNGMEALTGTCLEEPWRDEAGLVAGWHPVVPATLEDGTPVGMSDLARVLCDCEISRVVVDAEGVPLDLGRGQRLYTGQQRRAVIVRDRQCAWNGCEVRATWCDVHHIRWWDRDLGPTSVENGLLVCGHHHTVLHQLDLLVERLVTGSSRGGARWREPVRYRFRRRDGSLVNGPPGDGAREVA